MAPHSSILVWRIPRTEEPGELQSMGSLRVGDDWAANTFTDLHTLSLHLSAMCLVLGQLTDYESLRQDPPPLPASPEEMCSPALCPPFLPQVTLIGRNSMNMNGTGEMHTRKPRPRSLPNKKTSLRTPLGNCVSSQLFQMCVMLPPAPLLHQIHFSFLFSLFFQTTLSSSLCSGPFISKCN